MSAFSPEQVARRLGEWRDEGGPLYEALASAVARAIEEGVLPPGGQLPAERRLAGELHVSRGTVVAAYEELRGRGLVETRHGSGTVVRAGGSPVSGPREAYVASSLAGDGLFRGAVAREDDVLDLYGAYWFGTEALDEDAVARATSRVLAAGADHGYHVLGLPALRAAIAGWLTDRGLDTRPSQVMVTTGAQQAISLAAQLYVGAGDRVVVEEPTFAGAVDAMRAQQATVLRVPVGANGADVAALGEILARESPRLVYLIPSVHNPTGGVMPRLARQRVAELVADADAVVLDDATLLETQRHGAIVPPIAAFADASTQRRLVTVGSFSKPLWGGLRVGWVRAEPPTLARLARLKAIADVGTPLLSQAIVAELLEDADERFGMRREGLGARHDVLVERLARDLPEWRWDEPLGGLCLWVDLAGQDAEAFVPVAERHGVGLAPPGVSSASTRYPSHLRVPFGQPPEVLHEAVDRLAAAWEAYRHEPTGERRRVLV
ncbi:PLP-dependent aminotransferase family protein [Egibacter rhizosphaerae]|uniref:aminotransferase-like domain-containing protein n=1 Tax=Egibacter rhizosphaerae TaxID=1670831 RepID=UPI0013F16CF7|nr:PLP-dependent aminotransferase family protein [Egibacter rhizosphaerae]